MKENYLKNLRERKELKQKEVCEALGISVSYLSSLESGHRSLPLERLEEFAVFYGVDILELWVKGGSVGGNLLRGVLRELSLKKKSERKGVEGK